jgi:hypothetical protein
VLALLTVLAFAPGAVVDGATGIEPVVPYDPIAARGEHVAPAAARELSKKEEWLREKALRPDFHTTDADLARGLAVKPAKWKAQARARRDAALGTDPAWVRRRS